jgi:hypothetical protein
LVPANFFAVVVFFVFILPGTCYELLRGRTRLPRDESSFLHVSRIVLSGTIITTLTMSLLGAVHWIAPSALLDVAGLLKDGTTYVVKHVALVAWTLVVQIVLSSLLAVVASDLRSLPNPRVVRQATPWHGITELTAKPGWEISLSVRLKSGAEIVGRYLGTSVDLDPTKRELLLRAPFSYRGSDEQPSLAKMDDAWQKMVIAGSEIVYVTAAYSSGPAMPAAPVRWRNRPLNWLKRRWLGWQVAAVTSAIVLGLAILLGRLHAIPG